MSRALALCGLRKNRWRPEEREAHAGEDMLEELSGQNDPEGRRKKGRTLRNEEFLVALILDGEGRGDAVPPSWREPMEHLMNRNKRSRAVAFAKAVPVQLCSCRNCRTSSCMLPTSSVPNSMQQAAMLGSLSIL